VITLRRPAFALPFTLIEAVLVLLIGGVLLCLVGAGLSGNGCGRGKTARRQLERLATMVRFYRQRTGELPPSLAAICPTPSLDDPWEHEFVYARTSETTYELFSLGRDGVRGTDDDVRVARDGP
jgi:hypothetical protein